MSLRKIRRVRFPALVTLLGLSAAATTPFPGSAVHPATAAVTGSSSVLSADLVADQWVPHIAWAAYAVAPEAPPYMSAGPVKPVPVSFTLSGDRVVLSEEILTDPNVVLSGRDVFADIDDTAAGGVGTAGVPISTALLRLILVLSEQHTIAISSIEAGGTGHCPDAAGNYQSKSVCPEDPHYNGDAIDFFAVDGQRIYGRDAGSLVIIDTAVHVLPAGSGFGQSQCGSTPALPPGWITLPDLCSHLHVQVPLGSS